MYKKRYSKPRSDKRFLSDVNDKNKDIKDMPAIKPDDQKRKERDKLSKDVNGLVEKNIKQFKFETFTAMGFDDAITAASKPYPLFGRMNKAVDISYGAKINDLARNAIDFQSSPNSVFAHAWDVASLRVKLNYNYISPATEDKHDAGILLETQARTIREILTAARLENYNQLDILTGNNVDFSTHYNYTGNDNHDDKTPVHYVERMTGFLNSYQANALNLAIIPAYFNRLRALLSYITTMAYQEGDLQIGAFSKQLNKKTIVDVFENFNIILRRLHLDPSWVRLMSSIGLNPSRKFDEILSPMLTIDATNQVVESTMTAHGVTININETDNITVPNSPTDPTPIPRSKRQVLDDLVGALNPYNILRWARQNHHGLNSITPEAMVNYIVDLASAYLNHEEFLVTPAPALEDLFTTNDRLGINNWTTGATFTFNQDPVSSVNFNKLVDDIYRSASSGGLNLQFDNEYMDWRFSTIWDRSRGISSFDLYKGGMILACSYRNLNVRPNNHHADTNPILRLIAQSSENSWDQPFFMNRHGYERQLTYATIDGADLMSSIPLRRLNPLGINDWTVSFKIPTLVQTDGDSYETLSMLQPVLQSIYGYGQIISANDSNKTVITHEEEVALDGLHGVRNVFCDSSAFSVINIRTNTFGHESLEFMRSLAPFRVPTSKQEPDFMFKY